MRNFIGMHDLKSILVSSLSPVKMRYLASYSSFYSTFILFQFYEDDYDDDDGAIDNEEQIN